MKEKTNDDHHRNNNNIIVVALARWPLAFHSPSFLSLLDLSFYFDRKRGLLSIRFSFLLFSRVSILVPLTMCDSIGSFWLLFSPDRCMCVCTLGWISTNIHTLRERVAIVCHLFFFFFFSSSAAVARTVRMRYDRNNTTRRHTHAFVL